MSKYFHGINKNHSFLEGWYFKHIHNGNFLSVTPGIHFDHVGHRFAFIEVITNQFCYYVHYPFSAFDAQTNRLKIQIANNLFSTSGIRLSIDTPDLVLKGTINYAPLPDTHSDTQSASYSLPFLDYYSQIISLSHHTSGFVKLNDELISFDHGKGYIETDWGRNLPTTQIWTHCNSFPGDVNCSIMVSISNLHFLNTSFTSCYATITYLNEHYRFASHLGSKLVCASSEGFVIIQKDYHLEVQLLLDTPSYMTCSLRGDMTRMIHKSSKASIRYHLQQHGQTIFDLFSDEANFEYII